MTLPPVGGDEVEWMIVATSGEYYITGLTVMHALANFYVDHPWTDDIHAICVQGDFQDGFRWTLEHHEEDWKCPECRARYAHKLDCQTGRVQYLAELRAHDEAFGGPELRAAEKFERDNPHD